MLYILVDANILKSKGIEFFREAPDGRGIVEASMLRLLGDQKNIETVTSESLKERLDKMKCETNKEL